MQVPHLVQYQGSKRNLAPEIVRYFPAQIERLIEPFCGTAAISIYVAAQGKAKSFLLNDINSPLVNLLENCVDSPGTLCQGYQHIWEGQFGEGVDSVEYFHKMRNEFNQFPTPSLMLFMLARVVKGAVRYNSNGQMNQSCDKRRYGTNPERIRENADAISKLKGKNNFSE